MMQSEFETLTGILPDVLLYEAAEQEYNNGDWASKAEFCDCFKADEDGIATKCQRAANERWFKMEEQNGSLLAENENLRNEIAGLADRVDELTKQVTELPTATLEVTENDALIRLKVDMLNSLLDAAHEGHNGKTILHMVFGFDLLLAQIVYGGVSDD